MAIFISEGVEVKPGTMVVGCSYNEPSKKVNLKLNNGEQVCTKIYFVL